MYIHGSFYDISNNEIEVQIVSYNDTSTERIIGEDGLYFGGSPLSISTDIEDTFTHVIKQSLEINFVTDNYVGDLFFSNGARDITVKVLKNDVPIFVGYVTPTTFTQPYVHGVDEFTVNCTDILSTLQYYNYKNVIAKDYDEEKLTADVVQMSEVIKGILDFNYPIYYDTSKGVSSSGLSTVFNDIEVSEIVFYDDDADSIKNQDEILNGILQYLNLHIIQQGESFYIFDWDSIKNGNTITWTNIQDNTTTTETRNVIGINSTKFANSDTNITIADVYSQISLTCDLLEQDTLIENPLDSDSLTSLYSGKQPYMVEYISEGRGEAAVDAFYTITKGLWAYNYDYCKTVHWFIQVMQNPNWKMNIGSGLTIDDLCEQDEDGTYINQWKIPQYLRLNSCTPAIMRLGNYEKKGGEITDNSLINKIDMTDYLCISINGNETSNEQTHYPSDELLRDKAPIIEYVGSNGGALYSPSDDKTINYLVFSGRILLQPIQYESSGGTVYQGAEVSRQNNFETIRLTTNAHNMESPNNPFYPNYDESTNWNRANVIKSDNNNNGRYYTRKFYTIEKQTEKLETYMTDGTPSFQPWTKDKSAHGYLYEYSAEGDGSDRYSKLPILECELIIGDKRLIETDMDEYGNSTFEWVHVGQEPTEEVDGETYTITTFSLGVNPKMQDYIIGDEYDIQNTIDYTMNIDASGTAIPIRKSDGVSGKVTFKILGAINTLWNDVARRHPSFWRHTRWSSDARFILAHCENILIKDFECKVYTNNGMNENEGNNELVYMSAENENYVAKKDDIDFMFATQLTADDAAEKGVNTSVILNATINHNTQLGVTSIYNANTNETAKAEEHYINQYYNEYSEPKIELQMTLHDDNIKFTDIYSWNKFTNKQFYPISINRDIRLDNATLTLKEK